MEKALCVSVCVCDRPLPVVLSQYFRGSKTPGDILNPQLLESHFRVYWLLQSAHANTHTHSSAKYKLLCAFSVWPVSAESTIKRKLTKSPRYCLCLSVCVSILRRDAFVMKHETTRPNQCSTLTSGSHRNTHSCHLWSCECDMTGECFFVLFLVKIHPSIAHPFKQTSCERRWQQTPPALLDFGRHLDRSLSEVTQFTELLLTALRLAF